MSDFSIPQILPNGAILRDIFYNSSEGTGIVFAQNPKAVQPYITWKFYRADLGTTSHGNYFKNAEEAYQDFLDRCAEYGGYVTNYDDPYVIEPES